MTRNELIKAQNVFMKCQGMLVDQIINKRKYFISPGEMRRWNDPLPCPHCGVKSTRQEQLVEAGLSWTFESRHLDGLAWDTTIFKWDADKNKFVEISGSEYLELGVYWEGLNVHNVHGLYRGQPAKEKDLGHFEYRP
jgi:hypothetical protein